MKPYHPDLVVAHLKHLCGSPAVWYTLNTGVVHLKTPGVWYTSNCGSLWDCNLALVRQAFIESSVVKLDYGKVSTTDLSSFDIPLWYTELQEMI